MRYLIFIFFLFFSVSGFAISEAEIDRLLDKAPKVDSKSDLRKLVRSLTSSSRDDEEKAYVLLSWVVRNVDYDEYKKNQIEENVSSRHSRADVPQNDILKTRLGVCIDIARLYEQMLEEAKINAVVIKGCNGEIDKKKRKCKGDVPGHAWIAAWINDQWELIDPTWAMVGKQTTAMGDISKKRAYNRELKKREKHSSQNYKAREGRRVDKHWFMTPPKTMYEDHHPFDEEWSLTKIRDRKNKKL